MNPLEDERIFGADESTEVKRLYVTRPHLPPLEQFLPYLESIWTSQVVTNGGPFHQQLERELCDHLGVEYVSLFANGTLALVTALKALRITGEVITTPFSFAATPHAAAWNGIAPVFADIDPQTMNLDPKSVEAAISNETTAILPVHCYGRPCDIEGIKSVADRHNLRVIYDAAHAFGVEYQGESVLRHGDLAVLSFHATKVFNTFEGGAIVSGSAELKAHIDRLKNFGIVDQHTVLAAGINAKMSEMNAALGLLQLQYIDEIIAARGRIDAGYRAKLSGIRGLRIPDAGSGYSQNYSYFPVFISDEFGMSRDDLYERLSARGVMARKYFFPLVSDTVAYRNARVVAGGVPNAEKAASEVLCLPIFPAMTQDDLERVCREISALSRNEG